MRYRSRLTEAAIFLVINALVALVLRVWIELDPYHEHRLLVVCIFVVALFFMNALRGVYAKHFRGLYWAISILNLIAFGLAGSASFLISWPVLVSGIFLLLCQ